MFPIKDTNPTRSFPFVNYLIIVANLIVFFISISAQYFEQFIEQYAFIPAHFNPLSLATYKNVLYSMFLHGGWLHILSNMWFLHIFGDNVEDKMGHFRYLLFYLLAGAAAVFAQYVLDTRSFIPMV